jgi:hypothetical protein
MQCEECERLWQQYAEAVSRYTDLVNQQEISARAADMHRLEELEAEVLAAAIRLISARHQAHSHAEIRHFHGRQGDAA